MIKASCHCGNVKLKINVKPEYLTECNCSICNRIGAIWFFGNENDVEISTKIETNSYSWGDKNVEYHYCPTCGSNTHCKSVPESKDQFVGINTRMADPDSIKEFKVRHFDGRDSWKYVD